MFYVESTNDEYFHQKSFLVKAIFLFCNFIHNFNFRTGKNLVWNDDLMVNWMYCKK